METQFILDREEKRRYRPVRDSQGQTIKLGSGAMGEVLLYEDDESGVKVAVKRLLSRHRIGSEEYNDFIAEQQVLASIQNTSARHLVPWAAMGENPLDPDQTLLILEYIDPEWWLSKFITGQHMDEQFGLETMSQYAHLLHELHHCLENGSAGYSARGDRKSADFFWDAKQRRLIVLDWNRAGLLPQEPGAAHRAMRGDLQGLGQIWSEYLLGQSRYALPDPDEPADEGWLQLSRGTRRILHKAVSARPVWAALTAKDVQAAALRQLKFLKLVDEKPQAVLDEIDEIFKTQRADWAEVCLDLADLVERAAASTEEQKQQAASQRHKVREQMDLDQATAVFVKEIINSIRLDRFDEAYQKFENELRVDWPGERLTKWSHLRFRRYLAVSQVGRELNYLSSNDPKGQVQIGEPVQRTLNAIGDLETLTHKPEEVASIQIASRCKGQIGDVHADIQKNVHHLLEEVGAPAQKSIDKISQCLKVLAVEARIHELWLMGVRQESQQGPGQARVTYDQAINEWQQFESLDSAYAADLIGVFDSLRLWMENSHDRAAQDENDQRLNTIVELWEKIRSTLSTRGGIDSQEWRLNLREIYQLAHPMQGAVSYSKQGTLHAHLASNFLAMDTDLAQGHFLPVLDQLDELRELFKANTQMQQGVLADVFKQIQYGTLQKTCFEVDKISKNKKTVSWIDDIEQMVVIFERLLKYPEIPPETRSRLSQAKNFWDDRIEEASKLQQDPSDLKNIPGNILEEAQKQNLEIFRRSSLPSQDKRAFASFLVGTLLGRHRMGQETKEANEFKKSFEAFADQVKVFTSYVEAFASDVEALRDSGRMQENFQKLARMKQQFEELKQRFLDVKGQIDQLQAPGVSGEASILDNAVNQVDKIDETLEYLEKAHERWKSLEPSLKGLTISLDELLKQAEERVNSLHLAQETLKKGVNWLCSYWISKCYQDINDLKDISEIEKDWDQVLSTASLDHLQARQKLQVEVEAYREIVDLSLGAHIKEWKQAIESRNTISVRDCRQEFYQKTKDMRESLLKSELIRELEVHSDLLLKPEINVVPYSIDETQAWKLLFSDKNEMERLKGWLRSIRENVQDRDGLDKVRLWTARLNDVQRCESPMFRVKALLAEIFIKYGQDSIWKEREENSLLLIELDIIRNQVISMPSEILAIIWHRHQRVFDNMMSQSAYTPDEKLLWEFISQQFQQAYFEFKPLFEKIQKNG